LLAFRYSPPHLIFLIRLGIIANIPRQRDALAFRMNVIPMTALAAPVNESCPFQIAYQLSDFARHSYQLSK
jgi:hypothetical protein